MTRLADVPLLQLPSMPAQPMPAASAPPAAAGIPVPPRPGPVPPPVAAPPPAPVDERPVITSIPVEEPVARRASLPGPAEAGRFVAPPADVPLMIDWGVVVVLRRAASEEIAEVGAAHQAEHGRPMAEDDRRMMARSVVRQVVRSHAQRMSADGRGLWTLDEEQAYAIAVDQAIFGYGRLQPLFELPEAENIEINGCDRVTVQFGDGRRRAYPAVADTDDELVDAIRFLGESASPSRPFDEVHPTMTLALGDRFRLHAIGFGLTHRGRLRNRVLPCRAALRPAWRMGLYTGSLPVLQPRGGHAPQIRCRSLSVDRTSLCSCALSG